MALCAPLTSLLSNCTPWNWFLFIRIPSISAMRQHSAHEPCVLNLQFSTQHWVVSLKTSQLYLVFNHIITYRNMGAMHGGWHAPATNAHTSAYYSRNVTRTDVAWGKPSLRGCSTSFCCGFREHQREGMQFPREALLTSNTGQRLVDAFRSTANHYYLHTYTRVRSIWYLCSYKTVIMILW